MARKCIACGKRPAATTPEWPALCAACLHRAGQSITPGERVVCTVDGACNGWVHQLADDGFLAVVRTVTGEEVTLPAGNMVRVLG